MRKLFDFKQKLLLFPIIFVISGCLTDLKDFSLSRSGDTSPQIQSIDNNNLPATLPTSEKRVALVIGNDTYPGRPLEVAVNDAKAIATTLRNLGFEVIYTEDITAQQIPTLLNQFANKAKGGELALFYFAGHGAQYGNENFLIPVDFKEDMVKNSLHASQVLAVLEQVDVPTKILILDACRNWDEAWGNLTYMESPARYNHGTFIAFSTEPNTIAADRIKETDNNGPYAKALVKYMPQGLPIQVMFNKVRGEVRMMTQGTREQTPWEYSSLEGGNLCLAPCVQSSITGDASRCKTHVGQGLYDGECRNNLPHGQGTIRYNDGEYYQGSFSNGVRHGKGIQYLTDGTEIRGVWINGKLK